jgi:dolichol kinase
MPIIYTLELYAVIFASFTYLVWNHSSCTRNPPSSSMIDSAPPDPPPNPRLQESRVPRRNTTAISSPIPENRGYVWMTVPKNYRSNWYLLLMTLIDVLFRSSSDDGLTIGLILGPLITSALYYVALKFDMPPEGTSQPPFCHIETPWRFSNENSLTPQQALMVSRRNAVDLSTLCSAALLIHVYASHWFELRYRKRHKVSEGERGSVPRSEARKGWMYIVFTYIVCAFLLGLRIALDRARVGVWKRKSRALFRPF